MPPKLPSQPDGSSESSTTSPPPPSQPSPRKSVPDVKRRQSVHPLGKGGGGVRDKSPPKEEGKQEEPQADFEDTLKALKPKKPGSRASGWKKEPKAEAPPPPPPMEPPSPQEDKPHARKSLMLNCLKPRRRRPLL